MAIVTRICDQCGKEYKCERYGKQLIHPPEHTFCSQECSNQYKRDHRNLNAICQFCGCQYHVKPSALATSKYCSKECFRQAKMILMKGNGNHQYGLKGHLNASWKSDTRITNYGYIKIRLLDHPFCDCDGFVFEHRLVAEKYLLTEENSIEINGVRYLKPEYDVHHINEDRMDNRPENLVVLTKAEHRRIHNLLNPRNRDELGRFVS